MLRVDGCLLSADVCWLGWCLVFAVCRCSLFVVVCCVLVECWLPLLVVCFVLSAVWRVPIAAGCYCLLFVVCCVLLRGAGCCLCLCVVVAWRCLLLCVV